MPIDEQTREAYTVMAEENEDWSGEPRRRQFERPATRSLLPDVDPRSTTGSRPSRAGSASERD